MDTVPCPACDALLTYPPDLAGKAGRCPTCNAVVTLPAPDEPDDPWRPDRERVIKKKAKQPDGQEPLPPWAWIFAVLCGIIPVLTLGGAIPAAIGFGGAGACMSIARNRDMSPGSRVGICIVITVGCWVAVIVIIAAFVANQGRR